MNNICVIPARGGSTRIPKKNIKDFWGKPLIAYSIEKALESKIFSRVIVSTDDEEIARVAKEYGAQVPFLRDKAIADNHTSSFVPVLDAYQRVKDDGQNQSPIEVVTCIYATAPLMEISDLKHGFEIFQEKNLDYLYSCTEFPFPIQRAVYLDQDHTPHCFMPDCFPMRSQDLVKAYQDAAQFYFYKASIIEDLKKKKKAYALPIDRHHVVDIDTPEDFLLAKALYKALEDLKNA